jgi:hypothetical protein
MESGQRQAGLLDVRTRDHPIETVGARQELEWQPERLGTAGEQRADSHARLRGHRSNYRSGFGFDQRQLAVETAVEHTD